jgi:2-dehydropantoate 2-reductase
MRIAIVGLGAVGGFIAARLAQAGYEVCALARGATLQAVRRDGLVLIEPQPDGSERRSVSHIQVDDDPGRLGKSDLVVLSVKAPALASVAAQTAALLAPDGAVLSAMNGVPWWMFHGLAPELAAREWTSIDPGRRIAQQLPAERVIGSVVHLAATTPQPGVARQAGGTSTRLIVGEPAGGQSSRSERAIAALCAAGFQAEASPRIQQDVWFKLWGNMTMNPVSAFTGATADRILDDDLARGFLTRVMTEAAEIGARIGLPIATPPEERHVLTRKLGAFKTSMLQDVEAGRPVELDALVGAVREIGQAVAVPTPFTDALLGLTRVFARGRGLYPQAGGV